MSVYEYHVCFTGVGGNAVCFSKRRATLQSMHWTKSTNTLTRATIPFKWVRGTTYFILPVEKDAIQRKYRRSFLLIRFSEILAHLRMYVIFFLNLPILFFNRWIRCQLTSKNSFWKPLPQRGQPCAYPFFLHILISLLSCRTFPLLVKKTKKDKRDPSNFFEALHWLLVQATSLPHKEWRSNSRPFMHPSSIDLSPQTGRSSTLSWVTCRRPSWQTPRSKCKKKTTWTKSERWSENPWHWRWRYWLWTLFFFLSFLHSCMHAHA